MWGCVGWACAHNGVYMWLGLAWLGWMTQMTWTIQASDDASTGAHRCTATIYYNKRVRATLVFHICIAHHAPTQQTLVESQTVCDVCVCVCGTTCCHYGVILCTDVCVCVCVRAGGQHYVVAPNRAGAKAGPRRLWCRVQGPSAVFAAGQRWPAQRRHCGNQGTGGWLHGTATPHLTMGHAC